MEHLLPGDERARGSKQMLRADSNCTMSPHMASKTTTALTQSRQWGRIEVFPSAVAAIAGHAAMRCYGISERRAEACARRSPALSAGRKWPHESAWCRPRHGV